MTDIDVILALATIARRLAALGVNRTDAWVYVADIADLCDVADVETLDSIISEAYAAK